MVTTSAALQCGMLTVSEAARQLAVQESTIRAWILRGQISYVKLGKSVRIELREIQRLIDQGRTCRKATRAK